MAAASLSADEAALYDRQIRLWGVEAQQRMTMARVLVVSMTALAGELCKNLVLAGIGAITLVDDVRVEGHDDSANYLIDAAGSCGHNRAEAALSRLSALNPRVRLTVQTIAPGEMDDALLAQHHVVCAVHLPAHALVELDARCRALHVKFFAGDVFGLLGVVFCDLQDHAYVEERKQPVSSASSTTTAKDEVETIVTAKREMYASLAQALAKHFGGLSERKQRSVEKTHLLVQALWEHWAQHGGLPDPDADGTAGDRFVQHAHTILQRSGLPTTLIDEGTLRTVADGALAEIAPVVAIVGGYFAQEVLKAVSGKELPINNFFYYNGLQGTGNVEQFQ